MNEMMNPNMMMGGNMMMARGQDGSVNLFGDMTIINQHTYAPRQQNPLMQIAQIAQLQMANQNKQMELALEHEKLMLEAKKMDMLDRMQLQQQNNLLGNGNPEKVLAIGGNDVDNADTDNISAVDTSVAEDVEYEIRSEDSNSTSESKTISSSNKATPIKPNIFKFHLNADEYEDVEIHDDELISKGKAIDIKNPYIDLLKYYNTSGELEENFADVINGCYVIPNVDKPTTIIIPNWYSDIENDDYDRYDKALHIVKDLLFYWPYENKDAIEKFGILVNLFYKNENKSTLIFIQPTNARTYKFILKHDDCVKRRYDNYQICEELRKWVEDENVNLRMCNIDRLMVIALPTEFDRETMQNKNCHVNINVCPVFIKDIDLHLPVKEFINTYTEIDL